MEWKYDRNTLYALLEHKDYAGFRAKIKAENEVNIAELIESLPLETAVAAFRTLPKGLAADVFSNLSREAQQGIITSISDGELSNIIEDLYLDDAVDMLEEMPASVVKRVMQNACPQTRRMINQFLNYPVDSVGSIMTAECIELKKTMSVSDAIAYIRANGRDSEQIYTCYVTGHSHILCGIVTLKELLLSSDDCLLETIMNSHVITAATTEDQEAAVQRMMKYDLLALPVVDQEKRLVGIVTVDDGMDVMQAEATEDFEKMAAIAPSERPYLKTGVFTLAKKRFLWLMILMVSGMVTGGILGKYELAFAAMPLLVTFIPMLTDTGGNAGSQSSTLVIRGMAVGEIKLKDFGCVLWKELRVSLLAGTGLALVNFIRLMIQYPGNLLLALTVSLALLATVVIAKTVGGVLPLAAKALKVDPAIMAAPLITTIVDALSLLIYFTLVQTLLPI